jgi:flagellin-like hook-associated protein FlgL
MSVTIGSNIAALKVARQLGTESSQLSSIRTRLASGQRINRSSDDAAGLSISDSLRTESRILGQAIRNGNDAISALNIADGAYTELGNIVTRISELAEQSANGTYTSKQSIAMDTEAQSLRAEYNRIINTTQFNGQKLLDGSLSNALIQVGTESQSTSQINVSLEAASTYIVADGTFQAMQFLGTLNNPIAIEAYDSDNDGDLDLVVGNSSNVGSIRFYENNGDGTFLASLSYSGGRQPSNMELSDLNHDNILDAVTDAGIDGAALLVNLGNADGSFAARVSYSTGLAGASGNFRLGDVNGDNHVDMVIVDSNAIVVMSGNGDGTFLAPVSTALAGNTLKEMVDLNNDNKLDLITTNSGGSLSILMGNGNGTFGAPQNLTMVNYSVEAADLDGDGDLDLIATGNTSNNIQAAINQGNGTFTVKAAHTAGTNVRSLDAVDINSDGIVDVVSYSTDATSPVHVHIGNGDGTFQTSVGYAGAAVAARSGIKIADINGDGGNDIIIGTDSNDSLNIYLGNVEEIAGMETFSLRTITSARSTLDDMRNLLTQLASRRATIGAAQSRIQTSLNNNAATRENVLAANSRILDVDVAEESAQHVRLVILQQIAQSILAQANQLPAIAFSLIK